jgi:long-chain acyl-CoA synthetase
MDHITRTFDIPYHQLKEYPKADCLTAKINGTWQPTSTATYVNQANAVSRALIKMGVQKGEHIALITSVNRPEWNIMDMGILQVAAVDVPLYPTISSQDYEYIFNHAGITWCFVSDAQLFDKINAIRDKVPTLKGIYSFDKLDGCSHWSELLDLGADEQLQPEVQSRMDSVKETDLATIIYTSGTTGKPKGVMLSHRNLVSNAKACIERLPVDQNGKALTFLPVCHVYERMLHYLYQVTGVSIYFAESMDTIGDNLKEVQPNVFTAVPRLLEKVYDKIMARGHSLTGIKKKLFFWAVRLGEEYDTVGKGAVYKMKLAIARKLIFSKWQAALGGRCQAVASGSAALSPRLARIYLAAGIPVMEGYGLTETSPVVSVNCQTDNMVRIGSVGVPLKGVEVRIARDGEILVKGPNVMMGYYREPELTAEVLEEGGWFHTGDIGEITDEGFLRITDRKKEMFKTSGGKYIAPQPMENRFKESPYIEQIMVIGENRKHPAALIVPAFAYIREWAASQDISLGDDASIAASEPIRRKIHDEVERINAHFGEWERIKKFELLPREFTVEAGEITPTLKLKRKVIMERYAAQIEKIYG